ncbi:hypothetical protein [uncultured Sneathiella sp.]|uniref:hypothetical protein n=1 Tax=uncultured Sneathiella sp. TaxID=879315 RepID=UPI0030EF16E2|tara:strand:- start:14114 stop:14605 length:492 start_codon:yes stop_codon:yes gene_type:complete
MKRNIRILSLVPTSRGTGYIIAETPPLFVLQRSVLSREYGQDQHIKELARLIAWNRPEVLLLEDLNSTYYRREKTRTTIEAVIGLASGYGIAVRAIAKEDVYAQFNVSETATKAVIARLAAELLQDPSITKLVPGDRRLWEAEPYWMPMFEALALLLTALKAD